MLDVIKAYEIATFDQVVHLTTLTRAALSASSLAFLARMRLSLSALCPALALA